MSEQNYDQVICPDCNHQFTAVPVNVQERIAELEEEQVKLLDIIVTQEARIAELEAEVERLREGIATHKDSFTNPDDYTEEDLALWALLEKGE